MSKELEAGIDGMKSHIPNIRKLIAQLMYVVSNEKIQEGCIDLKQAHS